MPDHFDPFVMAERGAEFELVQPLTGFSRIHDLLLETSGQVRARLRLEVDRAGVPYIHAHLTADPVLRCERCLQPFTATLETEIEQVLVHGEEDAEGVELQGEEVLVVPDAREFSLHDWLEDELILALPVVAHHPEGECSVQTEWGADEVKRAQIPEEQSGPTRKPFAGLDALMQKTKPK
ncbi:MAG: YceD family protein [Gammaproteobacteria bacterium]|jgi:uncharacterized protein